MDDVLTSTADTVVNALKTGKESIVMNELISAATIHA